MTDARPRVHTLFHFAGDHGGSFEETAPECPVNANRIRTRERIVRIVALGVQTETADRGPIRTGISLPNRTILAEAQIGGTDEVSDGYRWRQIPPLELAASTTIYIWSVMHEVPYCYATNIAVTHPEFIDQSTWYTWRNPPGPIPWGPTGGARHYVANLRFQIGKRDTESTRHNEVLKLASKGLGDKEIAATLGISTNTVDFHWRGIREKFDSASRTEAVAKWLRRNARLRVEDLEASRQEAVVNLWYMRRALDID